MPWNTASGRPSNCELATLNPNAVLIKSELNVLSPPTIKVSNRIMPHKSHGSGSVRASTAWLLRQTFCLIPWSFPRTRSMNLVFSSSVAHFA